MSRSVKSQSRDHRSKVKAEKPQSRKGKQGASVSKKINDDACAYADTFLMDAPTVGEQVGRHGWLF